MPPKKKPDKEKGPGLKEPKAGPSKAPDGPKKGKKGAKGPTRVAQRSKIAGGKKKVRQRVKKPKKPKATPAAVKVEEPAPVVVPVPVTVVVAPVAKEPKPPTPWVTICVLWLFEILQVTYRAWKRSWLKKTPANGNANRVDLTLWNSTRKIGENATQEVLPITVDLGPDIEDTWSYVTAASIATLCMSLVFQKNPKFYPMAVNLAFYALSPILGVLVSLLPFRLFDINMVGGQIFWLVSNPLRFWLIFTQSAPTNVTTSRLIVLANVVAICLVDYLMTLVFALVADLGKTIYMAIFGVLTLAMAIWLAYLVFIEKKYRRLPDQIDGVIQVYEKVGDLASASFRSRQTLRHLLTFLPLLFPWSAFFVTRDAIAVTAGQIDDKLLAYRLDLATAIVTIPCVSLGLWKLKWPRYEVQDLLALTFAHVINVLALSIFFYIIFHSPLIRKTTNAVTTTNASTTAMTSTSLLPNQTSTTLKVKRDVLGVTTTKLDIIVTPTVEQGFQEMLEKMRERNSKFPVTRPGSVLRANVSEPAPKVLLVPIIMAGIGLGIAPACYFHFIWIQCPFRWKAPIIATSFTTNFIFGWATRTYLSWFDQYQIITLLVVVGVCAAWHVMFSAYFWYHIEAPEQRAGPNDVNF